MFGLILLLVSCLSPALIGGEDAGVQRGDNGGIPCATCTILLSISSQLSEIYNESSAGSLSRICNYLPASYVADCHAVITVLAPFIEDELYHRLTPDQICYAMRLCYAEKKTCHLYPTLPLPADALVGPLPSSARLQRAFPWICYIPGVFTLCRALANTYTDLIPGLDIDGDKFSPAETLRGSLWRGRDCGDFDVNTRPGRRAKDGDRFHDHNCNGIYGTNATSGRPYEDELCEGSGSRGVIYIGDSVGAHFHVPPTWFTPLELSPGILTNLSYVISNEFDWPDVGFATGYRNATYMPPLIFDAHVDSLYLRLRARNRCNHRDYQNLSRNGATSSDTIDYVKSISRHQREDKPALVIYSMVGNDVCNQFADTVANMTSPREFGDNVRRVLKALEATLPPESHVVLVGLIDGGLLFKAMAKRLHPLGQLRKDLTYNDVYDWFNCMEIGPCHGWMTSNSTLRKRTSRQARKLSRTLKSIAARAKFANFDVHYMPNPFERVIEEWSAGGGQVWELIEPVDSLHPTQAAQGLIGASMWSYLEGQMPFVLGPVNARNAEIDALFGDQGGH